jgi:hypothetical protein
MVWARRVETGGRMPDHRRPGRVAFNKVKLAYSRSVRKYQIDMARAVLADVQILQMKGKILHPPRRPLS